MVAYYPSLTADRPSVVAEFNNREEFERYNARRESEGRPMFLVFLSGRDLVAEASKWTER
jgi:hypothetical protein